MTQWLVINCTQTGQDPVEKPPGPVTVAGLNHYWDLVRERAELEGARFHDLCHASQLCARNRGYPGPSKIVLLTGRLLALARRFDRPFFFDQGGRLAMRLGLAAIAPPLTKSDDRPNLTGKGGPVMFSYNPEKFASLYASALGQRLWAFLTRPEIVARLETASELSKPAVEGIEEQLLAEFRQDVLAHRVKQMIGHMVRQIMEQRDWVLDQIDVKVQSVPFNKATRYRRPDWFTFHAFRNTSDPRDVVITDRRQKPTLPTGSRWTFYATFSSPLKAGVAFGVRDIKQLRQQVHTHGYHRVQIEQILRQA